MKNILSIVVLLMSMSMLSGCGTRQVVDQLNGSTAQRLVTLSVDKLISELPDTPLSKLQSSKVWMNTHFIREDPIVAYASSRMKVEIEDRHQVEWVSTEQDADMVIDVFFTSLGTDQDSFGISLPIPTLDAVGGGLAKLDIISLNMYHGVSELYYYVRDSENKTVDKAERHKAQIRTDKLSFPIITIPISTLD